MARVCAEMQGVQRQEGQPTDTQKKERKKNETRETIPILIIHNLVRQFQSSFVLFLLHFFFLFFRRSLVHVHISCDESCGTAEKRRNLRCSL